MNTNTVGAQNNDNQSAAITFTGGRLARSDKTILSKAFPTSPIIGADYEPIVGSSEAPIPGAMTIATVTAMKAKLVSNTVSEADMGTVQAYWGWATEVSVEGEDGNQTMASSGDLTYNGAPDIPSNTTTLDGNANIINLASPYMPNLNPPTDGSFTDFSGMSGDNQDLVALDEDAGQVTKPPFRGNGLANPKYTSEIIHDKSFIGADSDGYVTPLDTGSGDDA